ncbi:MAG: D-tyrosyl-tRNA(Tyr) deacylase [Firmicutes bacterium]|nr:D-tyrosyl-tRNA(Tyr) deacylase [Bacillota bacterium]
MRAVVQRVKYADVKIEGKLHSKIENGLAVLLGIGPEDSKKDLAYMTDKLVNLRIFEDDAGKMNLSVLDIKGKILLVPNFTLYADARHGRRPDLFHAAPPEIASPMFDMLAEEIRKAGVETQTGVFGADMLVTIENDGPITLLLDSQKLF